MSNTTIAIPVLPTMPDYPPAPGPDRDEWHRLAKLHMEAGCIRAQLEVASAQRAQEAAQRDLIAKWNELDGTFSFAQLMSMRADDRALVKLVLDEVRGDATPPG